MPLVFGSPQAVRSWVCLEPDAKLAERAATALAGDPTTSKCEVRVGTTQSLPQGLQFDALLYIDVLEHIENDADRVDHLLKLRALQDD